MSSDLDTVNLKLNYKINVNIIILLRICHYLIICDKLKSAMFRGGKCMFVNLLNQQTGKTKKAKVGFSWTTFFFGFFPAVFRED